MSLRWRPIVFLAVFVRTHGEKLHRFISGEFVLDPLKQKIVPIEDDVRVPVFDGVWAKIHVADVAAEASVAANLNQKMLLGAGCFVRTIFLGTHVVTQRAGIKN